MSTELTMTELMQVTVDEGASDLHVRSGIPPSLRIHGSLTPLDVPALTEEDTRELVYSITPEDKLEELGIPVLIDLSSSRPLSAKPVSVPASSRSATATVSSCV